MVHRVGSKSERTSDPQGQHRPPNLAFNPWRAVTPRRRGASTACTLPAPPTPTEQDGDTQRRERREHDGQRTNAPDQNFPSSESFVDCAGVRRHFELGIRHLPNHGYAAEAREVTTSEHGGYVFKAFAEASGTMALARLRGKVRQGLAQRFLIQDGATVEKPFERIRGRIDSEGIVVDGRLVTWEDFLELLQPYEGWEFDLRIPLEPDW